jgi:hypothetical protein
VLNFTEAVPEREST